MAERTMGRLGGPGSRGILLGTAALLAGLPLIALAQNPLGFNERQILYDRREAHAEDRRDKDGNPVVWVLDFHFKDPRLIKVNIPARGPRQVWYLWYQVANTETGNPFGKEQTCTPNFVWVCHDTQTVHADQILPKAQAAVQRIEDPDNVQDIKNSVTISGKPIPFSKEKENGMRVAFPRMVTGVAMWDDIDPRSDRFSIFVYGLSDGYTIVDGADGKPVVRRKTLQLKFKRLGDEFNQHSGEIRFAGHEWIYATSDLPPPVLEEEKPMPPKVGAADAFKAAPAKAGPPAPPPLAPPGRGGKLP